jgi:YVTN family beta-propeller protein
MTGIVGPTTSPSSTTPSATVASTTLPVWPKQMNGQLHRKIGETRTGPSPKQVAFSPDGTELWVPLLGAVGVDVYKVPSLERVARIRLGTKGGVEVIFNRDGTRAYVSQMHTASVYEIDRAAKRVLRVIPTKGNWTKVMALSPDERTLYAANWVSDDISEIDLTTGVVRRKFPTVDTPRGLVVSPDGKSLYVAGFENGDLVRVDLATLKRTSLLYTGGAMRHLALDPVANRLYADDMGKDTVFAIDLGTDKSTVLARTDSHPNTIDLTADGQYVYVSNRGQNSPNGYYVPGPEWGTVLVIDTQTGRAVDAIVGGNQTTGLDVSPDGKYVAFTDFLDGKLQLFEIPPSAILAASDGQRLKTYRVEVTKANKRKS